MKVLSTASLFIVASAASGGDLAANRGAFEGGPTGTPADTKIHNAVQEHEQRITFNNEHDIPTGGFASPLFGAEDFSMTMLRFEEFGSRKVALGDENGAKYMPEPASLDAMPDSTELDDFLYSKISPQPQEFSNQDHQNPWKDSIESYLGRELEHAPMEGRPAGDHWKHQRWDEFPPEKYFETATTGARENRGLRHGLQAHGYAAGTEFGPGGLYEDQTLTGVKVQFHPSMPEQDPLSFWGFDGTFPPKLATSRYGEPLLMRHHNALPVDVTANKGFGLHTLTTHEHNGHTPAESDGYANAFFFPGQYYDYRWPVVLAGHDSINTDANDPRAGSPDGKGGIDNVPGDWRETMSTHWFHDHMLDFTSSNVYKGIAAMYNMYSSIDRGNEAIDDGVNLRLPSGSHLDFGNRDYDVNLVLADKAWDSEGQLWFNPHNVFGFVGDRLLTNWCYKPNFDVRARRYRFRILDGSVSRFFKIAAVTENGDAVPVYMVANDGNIMEHAVLFEDGVLPTIGIAERYDIVIDFSAFEAGTKIYFVNVMSHKNGQSTDAIIDVADILDGSYHANLENEDGSYNADPVVGKFLQFTVREYNGVDQSMNPADYVEGASTMIPIRRPTANELDTATHRTFELERTPDVEAPWGIGTDGGQSLTMDPHRVSAQITKSAEHLEVWRLLNSGTWSHPYHIHFEEAVMLRKDGQEPPAHEKYARKDVFRLGPDDDSATVIELAYHFRDFTSTFMGHCHNTAHEDHAMLMRWDVENPGEVLLLPAPIPFWDTPIFEESFAVSTSKTGDGVGDQGPSLEPVKYWLKNLTIGDFDLATVEIGDALHPTEDERGWVDIPMRKGVMADHGNRRIFFVLHDASDEAVAEAFGCAYAGELANAPEASLSLDATYDPETDEWTFYGDLPNPVNPANPDQYNPTPAISHDNNYSPYRRAVLNGKEVILNAFFVHWGDEPWERLRVDSTCTFPDDPPNTNCMYNGQVWGANTGHALAINVDNEDSAVVRMKLHKSWAEEGDYLPYYIVVDSYPAGTANAMGIIYVPRHQFLGTTARPLVQFLPPQPLRPSYPPTVSDGFGLWGGGPLGGQIGLPSYFMPGIGYSPAWHIGFAHWNHPATEVIKSLDRVMELREAGNLTIHEFPPPAMLNNFDFESPLPPHVVNCPTPITIDTLLHIARKFEDTRNQACLADGAQCHAGDCCLAGSQCFKKNAFYSECLDTCPEDAEWECAAPVEPCPLGPQEGEHCSPGDCCQGGNTCFQKTHKRAYCSSECPHNWYCNN